MDSVARSADVIEIDDSGDESLQAAATLPPGISTNLGLENASSDFESDDDTDEHNEVEQKPLIAPSTNIQGDFEDALVDGFDFDGVFAFSQRYAMGAAPNPCLNIDGLGAVGLPLSERDASAIISVGVSVSGPGSESKSSGMWEIPAEKVHFNNPAWDTWIQGTAGFAASTALTAFSSVKPLYTLQKLVIHQQGSPTTNFKEPIDDDESNTKIGDFVAILPGLFDGGQLQLRHGGQIKKLNFAHQSALLTSIFAAYSGVEHTLSGVTSGYRLSLVYNIVQPMTLANFRPTLPELQGATQKLRHIMLSWKQDASGEAPEFLACLLQHKYAKTKNFRAKSLTGADALLVSHLHPIARELKFRLHLAHITVTVTADAVAEDEGRYDRYDCFGGRRGWGRGGGWGRRAYDYYDDEDDEDDEDIDEEDFEIDHATEETSLGITKVMDLRGMPVDVDLDLTADDLMNGSVTEGDPDSEDFERDDRTSATKTKVYKRTVLLIWPKDGDLDSTVTIGDVYEYACNALRNSLSVSATDKEITLVDKLLECCQVHRQEDKLQRVVQVLRESADRWNDVNILLRTLRACGVDKKTDLMGVEGFVSAYQAFGWDSLKDFYDDAMKNDESNARRHTLLARLTRMAEEEDDAEVAGWCKQQEETVLRSLSKVDAAQIPWLTELGLSRGGEFLRDIIFPQLQAQTLNKTFWMPFLQKLQQSMAVIPTTSSDVVGGLIAQCVSETARNLPAFPTKPASYSYYGGTQVDKSSDAILEVIKLCVQTNNAVLCTGIFAKMRDAARLGDFTLQYPPWLYYAELCPLLIEYAQTAPGSAALFAILQPFFVDVVVSLTSPVRTTASGNFTPCSLTPQHVTTVMIAAKRAGGIAILKQSLTPANLKGHDTATLQKVARAIVADFQPSRHPTDETGKRDYAQIILTLVVTVIDTFDTSLLGIHLRPQYPYSYMAVTSPSEHMLAILKFCFEVGAQSQCQRLLLRFVPPPAGSTVAKHVSGVLAPFLPVLRQYLATQKLDFRSEPYRMFSAAVVKSFADKVMSQKPTEVVPVAQLQTIGCGICSECIALRQFFLSEAQTISFPRAQVIRTHLERQLLKARAWGVVSETLRRGSPHTLRITKPASMTALGLWSANSLAGKALLAGLGDVTAQTHILGADYHWIQARMTGINTPGLPLASANQNVAAQKRVATTMLTTIPAAKKPRMS